MCEVWLSPVRISRTRCATDSWYSCVNAGGALDQNPIFWSCCCGCSLFVVRLLVSAGWHAWFLCVKTSFLGQFLVATKRMEDDVLRYGLIVALYLLETEQ